MVVLMSDLTIHPDIRLFNPYPGIYTIWPYSDGIKNYRSPVGQARLITELMPKIQAELGIKTVVWDTVTGTCDSMIYELATSQINKDSSTKVYQIGTVDDDFMFRTPGTNWRDNGMAQRDALFIRDRLLSMPINLILIGHQGTKQVGPENNKKAVAHGFKASGPATVEEYGKELPICIRVGVSPKKDAGRYVLTDQAPDETGTPYLCRVKGSGEPLPVAIGINGWDGSLAAAQAICAFNKSSLKQVALWGLQGAGKTAFASAMCALPGMAPVLVVAADAGEHEVPSWWAQAKAAIEAQVSQ